MKGHEKQLAWLGGGLLLLVGLVFLVYAVIVRPLRNMDGKTASLRAQLQKVQAERKAFVAAQEKLKELTQRTFSDKVDPASAQSGAMLTKQILASGLAEADFSRLPVGPRKLPGAQGAQEIGWSVNGRGPLDKIVNLLFLLEESPYVHRIENLDISGGEGSNQIKVRFRYLTLVIDAAPAVDPIDAAPKYALDSPERRRYDALVGRDFLRPYMEPAPPAAAAQAPAPPPPAGPGPENFQVVSLSQWGGQAEVHVLDRSQGSTKRYQAGQELGGAWLC